MVPPLVSHRHRTSAPAVFAASSVRSANSGLAMIAVEEMLGVVDHFLAVILEVLYGLGDQLRDSLLP